MSRATNHHAYYVTAIIDGGTGNQRTAWLLGPFETHREALRFVRPVRRLIDRHSSDPRFAFAAFGTAKRTQPRTEPFKPGTLPFDEWADADWLADIIDASRNLIA